MVGFRQLWQGDCPSPISHPVWTKVTAVGRRGGSDGAFVAPVQPPCCFPSSDNISGVVRLLSQQFHFGHFFSRGSSQSRD